MPHCAERVRVLSVPTLASVDDAGATSTESPRPSMIDLATVYPAYAPDHDHTPLVALGIDSFDLMTMRVGIEQFIGRPIPDATWTSFRTFGEMKRYCAAPDVLPPSARCIRVNMPHMAVGGLSEGWLFRELGDVHWTAICDALGTASHAIADALGNRLYATFVRILLESARHLKTVHENDELAVTGALSRYGASVWLTDVAITGGADIRAQLVSTFALREGTDNTALLRGEPRVPDQCGVPSLSALPPFVAEYRTHRANTTTVEPVAELPYSLNPYTDVNGVNLLYFAAYPTITDTAERQYLHAHRERYGLRGEWATQSATLRRDICYFANCAMDDTLTVRIERCERQGDTLTTTTRLLRASDGVPMARVETVKAIL